MAERKTCDAVGAYITCAYCGKTKKPCGRAAPMEMGNGLCDLDCSGYSEPPDPGVLWPGETCEEFGYHCFDRAVMAVLEDVEE